MRDGGQHREEKGRIQTVNSFPFLGAGSTSRGLWKTRRRKRWDRWCGMVFLMIEAEENDTYESQWWRNSEASGLQEGEIREKDGQVWVTGFQVNAAVEATAAPSDGSKSPGTLPPFPFYPHPRLFPNDSSTTSSPPCLHYDSHPLPRLNYCCSPWESSITLPPCSVIIKQVYELRPVPDCIEEPSSAVFMRLRAFVRTLELTRCWLWWHFNRKSFQS